MNGVPGTAHSRPSKNDNWIMCEWLSVILAKVFCEESTYSSYVLSNSVFELIDF